MKTSKTKFVTIFLISAFAFQFITNSLLGPEMRLFPVNGDWFPGTGAVATILYPIKLILVGPLSPLFNDPDPAPPILVLAFALYWAAMALALHFIIDKIVSRKRSALANHSK